MQNTLHLCTLWGIPIIAHYTLAAYLLLSVLATAYHGSAFTILLAFLVNGPILFMTVLVHELGHSAMARHLKLPVHQILLWPLGGLAYINDTHASHCGHILVALAGPLTHIPMLIIWGLPYLSMNQWKPLPVLPVETQAQAFLKSLLLDATIMQVSLFVFNLLLVRSCLCSMLLIHSHV
jgi:Zn-dependent protease